MTTISDLLENMPSSDPRPKMQDISISHLRSAEVQVSEVEQFLKLIEQRSKTPILTGIPAYLRSLKREYRTLQDLGVELDKSDIDEEALIKLRRRLDASCTTLERKAFQWGVLKRSCAFIAINQSFQGMSKEDRKREVSQSDLGSREKHLMHRALKEQARVEVDVVDWGREWIDIRRITEERLARQMTDCGWAWGDYQAGHQVDPKEWEDVSLVKQVRRLIAAAKVNRREYHIPRIRLVLPNITSSNEDIVLLLYHITALDPLVCVIIVTAEATFLRDRPPSREAALANLLGDELETLTPILNLDHTILIDLISDITHLRLEPQPWQSSDTRTQIEQERCHGGLMVKTLLPVLSNRGLITTKEAAEHLHELLKTVGTETERARGRLLVPFDQHSYNKTAETIRAEFSSLSAYPLPADIQIPVKVLGEDWAALSIERAVETGRLPLVARDVARHSGFKSSKLSIFMYGWASGHVTLTSNKEVRGQIRTMVEANRHNDEEMGPRIWRLEVTRNLLAKDASSPSHRNKCFTKNNNR